jgi:[ribosomal protein S5]-alanine N-acetyltransferase
MEIFAETERLILREILPTDVDGFFELDSDPDVHRYLGNKPITNKGQAIAVIQSIRQQYVDNGIGRWAVIDKKTNEFVGWTGLKLITEEVNQHVNHLDLGYRLIKRYWGKGIATETAIASLAYAFDKLHAQEVYAMANVENKASNAVLQKVGLKFVETFYLEEMKKNWYKIEKEEFNLLRAEP